VYCKHRFIATFSEPLELERFPFDRQLLCIKLTSELFGNRCRLQVAKNCHWKCADINRDAWEAEWNIVQVQNSALTSVDYNPATYSSTFRVIIAVERKNHVLYDECGVAARSCYVHFSCVRMDDIRLLHCQASFLTGTLVWKFLVNDWIPRKHEFAANHEKKWFSLWAGNIFAVLWFLLHVHLMVCWSEPGRVRLSWNEVYKVNNQPKFVVDDPHFIDDSSVEAHNSSKSLQNSSTALLVKSYNITETTITKDAAAPQFRTACINKNDAFEKQQQIRVHNIVMG